MTVPSTAGDELGFRLTKVIPSSHEGIIQRWEIGPRSIVALLELASQLKSTVMGRDSNYLPGPHLHRWEVHKLLQQLDQLILRWIVERNSFT